jgi:hypothetical protein
MEAGVPHFISLELTGRRFSQASNLDSVTSEMENNLTNHSGVYHCAFTKISFMSRY